MRATSGRRPSGRPAPGERHGIVVDPTGELSTLLSQQGDRATELREGADGLRDVRAAPGWLESVEAWGQQTARILDVWFDREVVTEFVFATGTGEKQHGLAERIRSARAGLRNGTELINALYSTQRAYRQPATRNRRLPRVDSELGEPRQIA